MHYLALIALYLVLTLCAGYVFAATAKKEVADIDVMVEAIREVEHWDGKSVGASGERGPWQIMRGAWMQLSTLPFECADGKSNAEKTEQRRVAREILWSISQRLKAARRDRDALTVAIVYCAGWNRYFYWQPSKPSKAKIAYGRRAEALYYDLLQNIESTNHE